MASSTRLRAAALDEPFREILPTVVDADYNLGALWVPEDDAPRRMAPVIAEAVTRVIGRARTA